MATAPLCNQGIQGRFYPDSASFLTERERSPLGGPREGLALSQRCISMMPPWGGHGKRQEGASRGPMLPPLAPFPDKQEVGRSLESLRWLLTSFILWWH